MRNPIDLEEIMNGFLNLSREAILPGYFLTVAYVRAMDMSELEGRKWDLAAFDWSFELLILNSNHDVL
jgi:hypothetical protein